MSSHTGAAADSHVYHVRGDSTARTFARLIGALLLILTALPLFGLLREPATGLAGAVTASVSDIAYDFAWSGALLAVLAGALAGLLLRGDRFHAWLNSAKQWLLRRSQPGFAALLGLFTAVCSALFAVLLLDGVPNQIDSIAQILHARFWAEGRLAGPVSDGGGFWTIQNALFTPEGWVSQYPPGHVAVMAASIAIGHSWLGNAVLAGVTVFMTALFAERILGRTVEARLGSVLLACSAFFVCIAGSFMNHVTAAAAVAVAAYAWTRAWQDRPRWAYLAGAAFAFGLLTRPFSTLAAAVVLVPGIPFAIARNTGVRTWRGALLRAVAGGAPFMLMLFAYNAHFFGNPFRLGYEIALGPAMGLGLHQDPWGNAYGFREAIGYTSADLVTLSVNLFETPVPSLLIISAFLLVTPRLNRGEVLFALWAIAVAAANFFYWHHGQFMGPRMLHESAPAWVILFSICMVGNHRLFPTGSSHDRRFDLRSAYAGALIFSFLVAFVYLVPQRVASYGGTWLAVTRVPPASTNGPAIVFVHDGWSSRVAMQLASTGMRLDEVETALRQNSTCTVQQYVNAVQAGDGRVADAIRARLDLKPRAIDLPPEIRISTGNTFRQWSRDTLTAECARQVMSDRNGVFDLAPLLARGDLPGSAPVGAMYVRDLGPDRNSRLIADNPGRTPYVYALRQDRGDPVLMPYDDGMRTLWGPEGNHALPAGDGDVDVDEGELR